MQSNCGSCSVLGRLRGADQSALFGITPQLPLQDPSGAEDPRLDRPDRNPEGLGHLGVRQPLEVAEDHHFAEFLGEPIERREDLLVNQVGEEAPLGIGVGQVREFGDRLDIDRLGATPRAAPPRDELVPKDRHQPRAGVAPGAERVPGPERTEHGVLHQVFGSGGIHGQPERHPVEGVEVGQGFRFEAGRGGRHALKSNVEHPSRGRQAAGSAEPASGVNGER